MWSLRDMIGINLNIAQHHLNISPKARAVKQISCEFNPNGKQTISNEINKQLGARFIIDMQYPQWFTNIVLVKKSNRN